VNTDAGLAGEVICAVNVYRTPAANTARVKLRGSAIVSKDGEVSSAIKVLLASTAHRLISRPLCFLVFSVFFSRYADDYAQYTPPTPTRRNCFVASEVCIGHYVATCNKSPPSDKLIIYSYCILAYFMLLVYFMFYFMH